jgi:hypothetical protein
VNFFLGLVFSRSKSGQNFAKFPPPKKTVVFVECSKCFCERVSSEREKEKD